MQNVLCPLTISGNFKSSRWKIFLKISLLAIQISHNVFGQNHRWMQTQNSFMFTHGSNLLHQVNASIHQWQGHIRYDQYQHWKVSQNWAIRILTVKFEIKKCYSLCVYGKYLKSGYGYSHSLYLLSKYKPKLWTLPPFRFHTKPKQFLF